MTNSKGKSFERKAEKLAEDFEGAVIRWVRFDRFFDGFRNTYGRILITALTWVTLYVYGAYAFITPGAVNWYVALLILLTVMNQLSVRFAFNVSNEKSLSDEYQSKRRDSAYKRAYRKVSHQLIAGLVLFIAARVFWGDSAGASAQFPEGGVMNLSLTLNVEQTIVLATFYIALFGLQKYMSWGFKGEPFLSKNEQP